MTKHLAIGRRHGTKPCTLDTHEQAPHIGVLDFRIEDYRDLLLEKAPLRTTTARRIAIDSYNVLGPGLVHVRASLGLICYVSKLATFDAAILPGCCLTDHETSTHHFTIHPTSIATW